MQVVVMAAGMGSRFGGLKQMEPMDSFGNFLLDYSMIDAKRAGFDEVVFIIKHEFEKVFKETIGARVSKIMKVNYAFQELTDLPNGFSVPEGRTKPWGTSHAILCAKEFIHGPFIIINGDDYYGVETYQVAYDFLKSINNKEGEYGNITFEVSKTMTENGSVKRGVIFEDENHYMERLVESVVERVDGKIKATPLEEGVPSFFIEDTMPVSMNLFAFSKNILDYLEDGFVEFLKEHGQELKSEYLIPIATNHFVALKKCTLKAISTPSKWYGITYREDVEGVQKALKELTVQGIYKEGLY